jgi:hypothetical protein
MLGREGRRQGTEGSTLHNDEGDAGLLRKAEDVEEDDEVEGEGAGLLPMDPEKTLAIVICSHAMTLAFCCYPKPVLLFAGNCGTRSHVGFLQCDGVWLTLPAG